MAGFTGCIVLCIRFVGVVVRATSGRLAKPLVPGNLCGANVSAGIREYQLSALFLPARHVPLSGHCCVQRRCLVGEENSSADLRLLGRKSKYVRPGGERLGYRSRRELRSMVQMAANR